MASFLALHSSMEVALAAPSFWLSVGWSCRAASSSVLGCLPVDGAVAACDTLFVVWSCVFFFFLVA